MVIINDNYKDTANINYIIKDRAIFYSIKSDDVDDINKQIINMFPGDAQLKPISCGILEYINTKFYTSS